MKKNKSKVFSNVKCADKYTAHTGRDATLNRPDQTIGSVEPVMLTEWVLQSSPLSTDKERSLVMGEDISEPHEDGSECQGNAAQGDNHCINDQESTRSGDTQGASANSALGDRMVKKRVCVRPGLLHIVRELLVNAADNHARDPENTTQIRVTVDEKTGVISVKNNGPCPPIKQSTSELAKGMWIPEMIFGMLHSGSNSDDSESRTWGGRNGVGATACNIFSKWFKVEINDVDEGKFFSKTWTDNMNPLKIKPARISPKSRTKKDWITITFLPDYLRFGKIDRIDADSIALIRKDVFNIAASTPPSLGVYFNETKVPVRKFSALCKMYVPSDAKIVSFESCGLAPVVSKVDTATATATTTSETPTLAGVSRPGQCPVSEEEYARRWDVAVALAGGKKRDTISLVNSVVTKYGGTHVKMATDSLCGSIAAHLRSKGVAATSKIVRDKLWVFVRATVVNPAFSTQTKAKLTTNPKKLGSRVDLGRDPKAIARVLRLGLVKEIKLSQAAADLRKDQAAANKMTKFRRGRKSHLVGPRFAKLEDAELAGTRRSNECTLVLTEGDSAKALAVAGINVVGTSTYGVFPLKGKPMNVRGVSRAKMLQNDEISSVCDILGIQPCVDYNTGNGKLRYGRVMIMADQDHDGSHIKGLVLNLFETENRTFIESGRVDVFVTPIVKASRKGQPTVQFFTLGEVCEWKKRNNQGKGWHLKYYKGLGTSTDSEARQYFRNIDRHRIRMVWDDRARDKMEMVYCKTKADARKTWLKGNDNSVFIDTDVDAMSVSDFVDKELIKYTVAAAVRAIPSLMDGEKVSGRKAMFGMFRVSSGEGKNVSKLVGKITEASAYHHGPKSMEGTIITKAATIPGKIGIPCLLPLGQFGTRFAGGKDCASARYIFTKLSRWARLIYKREDEDVCTWQTDDGISIEPVHYLPVVCMLLVERITGVATGYTADHPSYNPLEVLANQKRWLNGQPLHQMHPYFHGCGGPLVQTGNRRYMMGGVITSDNQELVSEILARAARDARQTAKSSSSSKKRAKVVRRSRAKPTKGSAPNRGPGPKSHGGVSAVVQTAESSPPGPSSGGGGGVNKPTPMKDCGDDLELADDATVITLYVTDLPVGLWGNAFQTNLDEMASQDGIIGYSKEHISGRKREQISRGSAARSPVKVENGDDTFTANAVNFTIRVSPAQFYKIALADAAKPFTKHLGLNAMFGASKSVSIKCMNAFMPTGGIQCFASAMAILDTWMEMRFQFYIDRKMAMLTRKMAEVTEATNLCRFYRELSLPDGDPNALRLHRRTKSAIREDLLRRGYHPNPSSLCPARKYASGMVASSSSFDENADGDTEDNENKKDSGNALPRFTYLLGRSLLSLSSGDLSEIDRKRDRLVGELGTIAVTTPREMFINDMKDLRDGIEVLAYQDASPVFDTDTDIVRAPRTGHTIEMVNHIRSVCTAAGLEARAVEDIIKSSNKHAKDSVSHLGDASKLVSLNNYTSGRSAPERYEAIGQGLPGVKLKRSSNPFYPSDFVEGHEILVRKATDMTRAHVAIASITSQAQEVVGSKSTTNKRKKTGKSKRSKKRSKTTASSRKRQK